MNEKAGPDIEHDPQSFVRSLARGLAVIEALGRPPGRHTLAELAAASSLNRAVARRILLTLVELGYCTVDGRYYQLTPLTLSLGLSYARSLPFWGYAQQVLEEVRAEINESCAMAVLNVPDIVYILRLPARRILPTNLAIGSRLPAFAVSLGRVMLAHLSDAELEEYLRNSERQAFTPSTLTGDAELRAELARVKEQGYAWIDAELDPAISGIAVPVRDQRNRVMAALSANFVAGSIDEERAKAEILAHLRRAAADIRANMPPS
ncbi:IclR family transcriptional regulator domain-containing protein [Chelativorans sp. YIM 93263]|uniref:IclR family transcriptional regulator domain-containing protein n=1 Tax=Chelativorans sp. YIM 93263 TaxID=2906648 RepID=UPI0023790BA4|nr:IclR family transcriptional regulator C-terminal domain-containing protein [Chelativorans sp. YIM 93263]